MTTYIQDYQGKRANPVQCEGDQIHNNLATTEKKSNDIPHELTYKTIMQKDFRKHFPNYVPQERKKYSPNDSPFLSLTSYQVK